MKRLLATFLIFVMVLGVPIRAGLARQVQELPLSGEGMYPVGLQLLTFTDEARDNREVVVAVFYPAIEPEDTSARDSAALIGAPFAGFRDAEPDASAALYPLILYSPAMGAGAIDWVAPLTHLASHGFVVASIEHSCASEPTCLIDRPMDVIFVLSEIAEAGEGVLAGIADAENVGVIGLEAGGYTALAAAGARIDPESFLDWSVNRDPSQPVAFDYFSERFGWDAVTSWEEIAAYRARFDDLPAGEPWPAISDSRIRAVLPITPSFGMLYGERGLESITVPTMIVSITANFAVSYENEVVPVFNNLDMEDRFLVTLVDYRWVQDGHVKWPHPQEQEYYNHFMLAFFGIYLQGQADYTEYLTPEFATNYDDVVWGVLE